MARIVGTGSLVNGDALPLTEMRAIHLVRWLGIEHDQRPPVQAAEAKVYTDDGYVVRIIFNPDGTGELRATVCKSDEEPPTRPRDFMNRR